MTRQLSNGQDIFIWHDPWLQGGKLFRYVRNAPVDTWDWVVSDIVEGNSWQLKDPELRDVWCKIFRYMYLIFMYNRWYLAVAFIKF